MQITEVADEGGMGENKHGILSLDLGSCSAPESDTKQKK